MRTALVLLVVTVLAHGGTWTRPTWAGSEAMRVLIAHEMVESGDLVVPRLGGETIFTKPPAHYWVLAAAERLFGLSPVAARTPSVLAIWWCACVAFGVLARRTDRRAAWLGAGGVAAAPSMLWHGAFAEIDPVFAATSAIAVVALLDGAAARSIPRLVFAGLAGAIALLTKGPPLLMFLAVPFAVAVRMAPRQVLVAFVPAVIVPVAAWLAALLAVLHDGASSTHAAAVAATETVGRIALFDRDSLLDLPVHALRSLAATLPFTPWLIAALRDRDPSPWSRIERACAWGLLGAVIVLAFVPLRPARYLLPGVPLVAIATARRAAAWTRGGTLPRWSESTLRVVAVVAALGAAALPFLPIGDPQPSLCGVVACGALAVAARTRLMVLVVAFAAPAILLLTVVRDRETARSDGLRDEYRIAELMRDELRARGVERFEIWGHPGEKFALALDPGAIWRDRLERDVAADWVIARWRDGQPTDLDPAAWIERVRIRGHERSFVLAERRR